MPALLVVFVAGAAVTAAVLMIVAGRARRAQEGGFDAEALAFVGGVLTAMFIAVAAFYFVIAWENAESVGQQATAEAAELADAHWRAGALPDERRDRVRALVRAYTGRVVEHEWGEQPDPRAADLLVELRREATAAGQDRLQQNVRVITDLRRDRLARSTGDDTLLGLLSLGTLVGAVLMVTFPLLMGLSAGVRHIAAIVLLAASLGVVAYVTLEMDHPFHGLVKVDPDAFRSVQAEFAATP